MNSLKNKKNIFYFIFIFSLLLSIFNSIIQMKYFDNYKNSTITIDRHSMITGDIEEFWREGDQISKDIKGGKNYFETGGEYRRPYLPSRIFALFSILSSENLVTEDQKISLGGKKIILLIFQSLFYYTLLFFLYQKFLDFFPKPVSQLTILFLAFEPTIFMYHSSFWSESIFFSLQLVIILFIIKKNHNLASMFLFGLLLGVFYLQRSVAIFYIVPVLIFYYFFERKNFIKYILSISSALLIIFLLVGFHNYKRAGIFYSISTQAKDGFFIYLIPEILAKKQNISSKMAYREISANLEKWSVEENIDRNKERDRLKIYEYQKKIARNVILSNPITSLELIIKNSAHFFVIDPLTHVYYMHRWDYDDGFFYKSEQHKQWILPRIFYSILIYFFCFFGIIEMYKKKKYQSFLIYIILSIFYFTATQSWYGGTRYFAPILIYLAPLFSFGVYFFYKKFNNNSPSKHSR